MIVRLWLFLGFISFGLCASSPSEIEVVHVVTMNHLDVGFNVKFT